MSRIVRWVLMSLVVPVIWKNKDALVRVVRGRNGGSDAGPPSDRPQS